MRTPYISVKQAMERLNGAIGKSLLYDLVARGQLRHSRLGSRVLIDGDHLDEILARNLRGPAAATGAAQVVAPPPAPPPVQAPAEKPARPKAKRRQAGAGIVLW